MLPHIDYDFDVEGDVILTLEKPNEPFAVWSGEDGPWELPRSLQPALDDEVLRNFQRTDPACKGPLLPGNPGRSHGSEVDPPIDPEAVTSEQAGLRDETISEEASQIRFRLSSRHLISASPYFRKILTGPWIESAPRAEGRYEIPATDWDENALKLLMDIVHGNSQNVPRSIDLELLAKVAVLVDYYKCYDVIKFYSDTWIECLGKTVKVDRYSRESLLVLFISCIFMHGTMFRDLTKQAMLQTREPLQSLGLPFPEGLIGQLVHVSTSRYLSNGFCRGNRARQSTHCWRLA